MLEVNKCDSKNLGAVTAPQICITEGESSESRESAPEYSEEQPPQYADVASSLRSLLEGCPKDIVSVPMVSSTEVRSFKNWIRNKHEVVTNVHVRRMTRDHYRKHYAHDAQGEYIGTDKAAVDAALVFVPNKSTPDDMLAQVRKVAFGREHRNEDFQGWGYGAGDGGG
ncbi:hypothetical protein EJ05DRAFT_489354 [Pseudovirgaria hyperparasitica]|uniref:Uncharacterized protein n=1 Tax=Pseudovirgaria hyperparasitica TaxID=470096 RepID=A0A6A6VW58_9PEZI|nr:uncharacterized protein EJ05DRAFT_489354 [Pseudovirgaria hyperparasitica]KAF2754089.1 hypothetical protein EJ05DRAFT_489354 [Pseudovirgaria hyperparasitica]